MSGVGLRKGSHGMVTVSVDGQDLADVTIFAFDNASARADLYIDTDDDLIVVSEVLAAAIAAVQFKMEKPRLKKLIAKRIEELRQMDLEGEEGVPPYPNVDNIPF